MDNLRKSIDYDLFVIFKRLFEGKTVDELFKTCLSCVHFQNEICVMANQKPPARVIVTACEAYFDEKEIPY